jgi:hypothetical protein
MRIQTRPLEADAEAWDPANPGPFIALAGSQFVAADGDTALIRTQGGCVMHAHPGWVVIRVDGSADGEARFAAPENVGGAASTWGTA